MSEAITPQSDMLEAWEEDVKARYPEPGAPVKDKNAFRNYNNPARDTVREFYRLNHVHQTADFVRAKRAEYEPLAQREMSVWEAMEYLNTLVDDSDPDTDLSQIQHLLQTSEAIRADGHPDWFILTGLIHDLGKILCLYGEPQWAVVGDTFPVGCAWSDKVVYPEFFTGNPDAQQPALQSETGIYEEGCGLRNVMMSWGHDEYMYFVTRDHLPEEALYMIRYHSFYAWHREGAYEHLLDDHDRAMLKWVQAFNPYDLYSKADAPPDVAALRPYYEDLIAKYFPAKVRW